RAKELLLIGELIDAQTASDYGLINFISPKEEITAAVQSYAQKFIQSVSANSVALGKALINSVQDLSLEDSLNLAVIMNVETRSSADCKKGISAFLNKERLNW
ncbi:MAG TPA: enoyl-CoA hydratase-related protein, partial [Daejeonella sp.]